MKRCAHDNVYTLSRQGVRLSLTLPALSWLWRCIHHMGTHLRSGVWQIYLFFIQAMVHPDDCRRRKFIPYNSSVTAFTSCRGTLHVHLG